MTSEDRGDSTSSSDITGKRRQVLKSVGLGATLATSNLLAGCVGGDGGGGSGGDGSGGDGSDGDGGAPEEQLAFPLDEPDKWSDMTLTQIDDGGLGPVTEMYGHLITEDVGVDFDVTTHPYQQLYERLNTKFLQGDPPADIVVYPPIFLGDMNNQGVFEPLDDYIAKYEGGQEHIEQTFDPFVDFYLTFEGKIMGLPIDGDIHTFQYRPSFFEDSYHQEQYKDEYDAELRPPETWTEYNQIAKYFTETLEEGTWGTFLMGANFGWAFWMNRAAPKGVVYFDEEMEPMVDSDPAIEALEHMVETVEYSVPGTAQFDASEMYTNWASGNGVMCEWWPDVTYRAVTGDSPVKGDQRLKVMPGWEQDDGSIKRNSTQAYSRIISIPAGLSEERKEAAFYAALRLSQNPIGFNSSYNARTGNFPYRKDHFGEEALELMTSPDPLVPDDLEIDAERVDPGSTVTFDDKEIAQSWIDALQANHEIGFPQPSWPGANRYNAAMARHIQAALNGDVSPEKALSDLATEMRDIRDDLGREEQQKFWDEWRSKGEQYGYL